jgi:hypothetical protein
MGSVPAKWVLRRGILLWRGRDQMRTALQEVGKVKPGH